MFQFPEPHDWQGFFISRCPSTNTTIGDYLAQTNAPFVYLRTDEQTQGRGQRNTHWESEAGKNLLLSLAIRQLALPPEAAFWLMARVSLAVRQLIEDLTHLPVQIKWPNDILIEGQKIAGILIENQIRERHIRQSIIGIGVNINQVYFQYPTATSLHLLTGAVFDLPEILHRILLQLHQSPADQRTLKHDYLKYLFAYAEEREFLRVLDQHRFVGRVADVNAWGQLVIESQREGIQVFDLKGIVFL